MMQAIRSFFYKNYKNSIVTFFSEHLLQQRNIQHHIKLFNLSVNFTEYRLLYTEE